MRIRKPADGFLDCLRVQRVDWDRYGCSCPHLTGFEPAPHRMHPRGPARTNPPRPIHQPLVNGFLLVRDSVEVNQGSIRKNGLDKHSPFFRNSVPVAFTA